MEACTNVIIERFEELCEDQSPEGLASLVELDIQNLISILRSDKLKLIHEENIIELIR